MNFRLFLHPAIFFFSCCCSSDSTLTHRRRRRRRCRVVDRRVIFTLSRHHPRRTGFTVEKKNRSKLKDNFCTSGEEVSSALFDTLLGWVFSFFLEATLPHTHTHALLLRLITLLLVLACTFFFFFSLDPNASLRDRKNHIEEKHAINQFINQRFFLSFFSSVRKPLNFY